MMQPKAIVLKLHGGSSDDISSWKKMEGEKKKDLTKIQDVKTQKKYLLATLIKRKFFQFENYFFCQFYFLLPASH